MDRNHKPPSNEQELERYIDAVLRRQPLRRAPANLEARVLKRLAAVTTRRWWQLGFTRWPWSARLLFLTLGAVLVRVSFLAAGPVGSLWNTVQQTAPASAARSGVQMFDALGQALHLLGHLLAGAVPAGWIYGAAAAALLLYAALFGLGAAAFRALAEPSAEHARY